MALDDVQGSISNRDERGNLNLKALMKWQGCPLFDRKLSLVRLELQLEFALMRSGICFTGIS
jgi:hypothetical protein